MGRWMVGAATSLGLFAGASLPAQAGGGDFAAGVVGGVILKTIIDDGVRSRPAPRRTYVRDPEAAAYWREVQEALDLAGYDVGRPDGIPGPRTRAAVRRFQVHIGSEPTGRLSPADHAELMRVAGLAPPSDPGLAGGPVDRPTPEDTAAASTTAPLPSPGELDDDTLDDLSAGTGVLGIGVGSARADADRAVREAVGACTSAGARTVCTGGTDGYRDEVAFATKGASADATVWLVTRTLSFRTPVDEASLEKRLADSLKPLMADPDRLVGSSAGCEDALAGSGLDRAVDTLRRYAEAGASAASTGIAPDCRAFYAVRIEGAGGKVDTVRIVLFDGRLLEPAPTASAAPASDVPAGVKF